MAMPSEVTPLLTTDRAKDEDEANSDRPIHVLTEIMGAHGFELDTSFAMQKIRPWCVVRFGSRQVLHRTKQAAASSQSKSPIWTVGTNSLCTLCIANERSTVRKKLEITLWTKVRRGHSLSPRKKTSVIFLGKVQLDIFQILDNCNEERVEFKLLDDVGREMGNGSTLALRFRIASPEDVQFVCDWNARHGIVNEDSPLKKDQKSFDFPDAEEEQPKATSNRPLPTLVTELDEAEVEGARLLSNMTSLSLPSSAPRGSFLVKPGPDPARPKSTAYMTHSGLTKETERPSQIWAEVGSGTVGRLYMEILSCHSLPNTDYGSAAVGNVTDAFCCAVYEDGIVQTPVISDELSPHWMPWTQRAAVFHMTRPSSSVLYLAVFGYKRLVFQHQPIGRVEVNTGNLQRDTTYDLTYNLSPSSHVTDRKIQGSIRIRLRMEYDNQRAALFAVLKPPPAVYINVKKPKSFRVAKYTCMGEYDGKRKFSWNVLLAYKDEVDEYVRRILFGTVDAFNSLIFWKGQVRIYSTWLPLHSLVFFCLGVLLIERPAMLPAVLMLIGAWFMLACMSFRLHKPSPWSRCLSFLHYTRILIFGKSSLLQQRVDPSEGYEETQRQEKAWKERVETAQEELKQREETERMVDEIEDGDTQTNTFIIPKELLTTLGKLQGMIGDFLRLCRLVDAVLTWEESAMSFWITSVFLVSGVLFLFVPWAFVLKWTARILFWGLCGPHMKLVDIFWRTRNDRDERYRHVSSLLQQEVHKARVRREEAVKLKAFRSYLFGRFLTQVPALIWTRFTDRPRPNSKARLDFDWKKPVFNESSPFHAGQQLYGVMIPRLREDWERNRAITENEKSRLNAFLLKRAETEPKPVTPAASLESPEGDVRDQGIEVIHTFDEEAGFVGQVLGNKPGTGPLKDSFVEPGVEISDILAEQVWSKQLDDVDNDDNEEDGVSEAVSRDQSEFPSGEDPRNEAGISKAPDPVIGASVNLTVETGWDDSPNSRIIENAIINETTSESLVETDISASKGTDHVEPDVEVTSDAVLVEIEDGRFSPIAPNVGDAPGKGSGTATASVSNLQEGWEEEGKGGRTSPTTQTVGDAVGKDSGTATASVPYPQKGWEEEGKDRRTSPTNENAGTEVGKDSGIATAFVSYPQEGKEEEGNGNNDDEEQGIEVSYDFPDIL